MERVEVTTVQEAAIHVLSNSADDHRLVLEFFYLFSRFEYALKRASFMRKGKEGRNGIAAEANWDLYADSIKGRFATLISDDFKAAREFLESEPPKKQIVQEGQLDWKASQIGEGESKELYLLRLVKTVRNNLFHGGKYPLQVLPDTGVDRNRRLICASIVVLRQCSQMTDGVGHFFREEA
jgi:hypothetical protein